MGQHSSGSVTEKPESLQTCPLTALPWAVSSWTVWKSPISCGWVGEQMKDHIISKHFSDVNKQGWSEKYPAPARLVEVQLFTGCCLYPKIPSAPEMEMPDFPAAWKTAGGSLCQPRLESTGLWVDNCTSSRGTTRITNPLLEASCVARHRKGLWRSHSQLGRALGVQTIY